MSQAKNKGRERTVMAAKHVNTTASVGERWSSFTFCSHCMSSRGVHSWTVSCLVLVNTSMQSTKKTRAQKTTWIQARAHTNTSHTHVGLTNLLTLDLNSRLVTPCQSCCCYLQISCQHVISPARSPSTVDARAPSIRAELVETTS